MSKKEINELIPKAYKLYDDNHPVSKREIDKLITKLHRLRKENMEDDEKDDNSSSSSSDESTSSDEEMEFEIKETTNPNIKINVTNADKRSS